MKYRDKNTGYKSAANIQGLNRSGAQRNFGLSLHFDKLSGLIDRSVAGFLWEGIYGD
ncbi:hypothetical protein ADIS_0227 [Lunatimonas lonarensis]|uniref:Uncharacterized protein n=1 Tax=Lunatimonas lonarensis TaxID=1232681 RepID=R7ZYP9_9BACT|nr:hypothetical protein ADIS_0227 [Lunatimonas lonarensis]